MTNGVAEQKYVDAIEQNALSRRVSGLSGGGGGGGGGTERNRRRVDGSSTRLRLQEGVQFLSDDFLYSAEKIAE